MLKTGWKMLITGALLISVAMLTACGGGAGTSSSSGSLALSISNAEISSGSAVTGTITLTSSTGSPVNGVRVRVVSSDTTVLDSVEGYTNSNGIANLQLPTKWISSDKTISLAANSDGITPSAVLPLKVLAPKLTIGIPTEITPTAWKSNFAFNGKTITSNYQLKLLDGNANPIPNQVITLYVDSLVNKGTNDQIVYVPTHGSMIIAPPGVFTGTTDSSGILLVPMYIQMDLGKPTPCTTDPLTFVETCTGTALSIMTANWRAVAQLASGQAQTTITTYGSSLITFTNTGS